MHLDNPSLFYNIGCRNLDLGWSSESRVENSHHCVVKLCHGASELMQKLLPPHLQTTTYISKDHALTAWKDALPANTPFLSNMKHQKSWDLPIIQLHLDSLLTRYVDQTSHSCILGASSHESGAWLNALPISYLGLRMSDDAVRTAIGLQVGAPICLPHPCSSCGHPVDEFGHHGLSCKFGKGRTPCHYMLNTIIHHSLASANIPSRLEPSNLYRADGKHPDGVTMAP